MGYLLPRLPAPSTPFLREDRTMKPWKLFWVLALAAAGPLEGQATGQISGVVRNSAGQPTAFATVTGAIGTITADQLVETVTSNPIKAMQDRLAGVDITNAGNKPGDQASIRIRGVRSITAGNDPLIVVDGVPISGRLDDLDPNNIVSIDVLKDAAATAIYGSRGANGVLLVRSEERRVGKGCRLRG